MTKQRKANPKAKKCEACQPNSKVRQHTCGLKKLQSLLPTW